jgi:TRAP-type C4-dicarboxylate transport system permease small subunit
MACMSIWSIVGRSFFEKPLVGDYELVQAFSAVAVALALPYTHWVKANVIVDFFTMNAPPLVNGVLDAIANLLVALFSAVIAWRLAYGLLSLQASEDASMLLGIPTWWIYLFMVPSFALLSLTALYGLSVNIERLRK